uniref:Uncharacterized protein n=1 Tax=Palpitomonas bilix TaxID=652834 RepID=A0A7S3DFB4_9EUKA|mmetsp:Transcript_34478/g.89302  ORF Transcript_34478/g.89302 Transcript_34478/m.89302 type:complete len:289 (+) Transcript_34478:2533-3399(+)|eukprot:CAMPEP_0113891184 /NCGR_PEP_ID=MMETSP0780_2-20120614/14601_1 /TAXON_ID=652834 /ORGANISM="Palpitomonas bilix" /LENGTH=288 /DNA_ID=CAMNT_0000880745 /DNA_START=835 /DNA_END=1701 /DNA_ORIENTATION=+ /assembly_acc=CAM_ASM_000599
MMKFSILLVLLASTSLVFAKVDSTQEKPSNDQSAVERWVPPPGYLTHAERASLYKFKTQSLQDDFCTEARAMFPSFCTVGTGCLSADCEFTLSSALSMKLSVGLYVCESPMSAGFDFNVGGATVLEKKISSGHEEAFNIPGLSVPLVGGVQATVKFEVNATTLTITLGVQACALGTCAIDMDLLQISQPATPLTQIVGDVCNPISCYTGTDGSYTLTSCPSTTVMCTKTETPSSVTKACASFCEEPAAGTKTCCQTTGCNSANSLYQPSRYITFFLAAICAAALSLLF